MWGIWVDVDWVEGYCSSPRVRPPQVSRRRRLSGLLPVEMLTSICEELESSITMILIALQLNPGFVFSEPY